MDAGTIVYKYTNGTQFRNVLYLQADIAKPEYPFEEEGETRDGYFFPIKQISEKHYRFSFLASEYLLDVMRFIRMADYAHIEKNGQIYKLDTFLITPDWEDNGDVAAVVDVLLMPPLRQKNAVTCRLRNCLAICSSRSRSRLSRGDGPGFHRPPEMS